MQPEPVSDHVGGVGIVFVEGVTPDRIAVITLVTGGPAERDGTVQPGDLVASVDGRPVVGESLNYVRQLVLGEPGTRCVLGFDRPSTNSSYIVALTRESKAQQMERERSAAEMLRVAEHRLAAEREARRRMEDDAARVNTDLLESRAMTQQEILALKGQLQREHDSRLAAEAQLRMLQQSAGRSESEMAAHLDEVSALLQAERERRSRADDEVRRLLAELERATKEKDNQLTQARQQIHIASEEARTAHRLRGDSDKEAEDMRNEMSQLADRSTRAEARAREAEDALMRERGMRERENTESMQVTGRLGQQLAELERQLVESNEARANLEQRLRQMLGETEALRGDSTQAIRALKNDNAQLQQELATWNERRTAIERTIAAAQEELQRERTARDRAETAVGQLTEQLTREKHARVSVEQRLATASEELRQRTLAVQQAERAMGEAMQRLRDMEAHRQTLEKELQAKNLEVAKARDELGRAAELLQMERNARDNLERQNRERLEQEGQVHARNLQELRVAHQQEITRVVGEGKARIQQLQQQLDQLNVLLADKQREIAKRNEGLELADQTLREAADQRRADQARIQDLTTQLLTVEGRMKQAKASLDVRPSVDTPALFAPSLPSFANTSIPPSIYPTASALVAPSSALNSSSIPSLSLPLPPRTGGLINVGYPHQQQHQLPQQQQQQQQQHQPQTFYPASSTSSFPRVIQQPTTDYSLM